MFYACFTSIPCLACQISTFFLSYNLHQVCNAFAEKTLFNLTKQDNDFMSWNSSFRIKKNSQEFLLKVILFTPLFLSYLFVISKNVSSNSPIHEFKVMQIVLKNKAWNIFKSNKSELTKLSRGLLGSGFYVAL